MTVFITFVGDPQTGDGPEAVTFWGQTFPKGESVEITDENIIERLRGNAHYVLSEVGEREAPPVVEPASPDDADLEIPKRGVKPAVDIPDGWQTQHHFRRIKWAKQIRPELEELINSADDADEIISEYMDGWS